MNKNATWALLAGVYATFALDVFGSLTSSPQTTEINAASRADTLMKWVMLASAVAIAGGVAGTAMTGSPVPLIAAGSVAGAMYFLYVHAKNKGLASCEPGTESY